MLPIATAEDVGGIKVGDGLQAASDGTLSAAERFSVYFDDYIWGIQTTWIAATACSISAGVNPGVAILEAGPGADITIDIYHLDNQTALNSDDPPTVGTVSFKAGGTNGTISFSKEVPLQAGNVLGLLPPKPTDKTAKMLRLVIQASKTG